MSLQPPPPSSSGVDSGDRDPDASLTPTGADDRAATDDVSPSDVLPSSANGVWHPDYRLDFTEVEGALEEIPEESAMAAVAKKEDVADADEDKENRVGSKDEEKPLAEPEATSSPVAATSTPAPAAGPPSSAPLFHIPDSNASDAAHSECSFYYRGAAAPGHPSHNASGSGSDQLCGQQPLTAKQQVALWLTRTSMSDLSSVPSLKSLVFGHGHNGGGGGGGGSSGNGGGSCKKSRRPKCKKGDMHRNYSSKSLMNRQGSGAGIVGGSAGDGRRGCVPRSSSDLAASPALMRKSETAMAAMSSSHNFRPKAESRQQQSCPKPEGSSRSARLNLFRRLASCNTGDSSAAFVPTSSASAIGLRRQSSSIKAASTVGARTPRRNRSFMSESFGGSGCESPLRGFRPVNRLRSSSSSFNAYCGAASAAASGIGVDLISNASSTVCSRCASAVASSFQNSRAASQLSLRRIDSTASAATMAEVACKICLMDVPAREMARLQQCGCVFCKECLQQYISFEVMSSAYDISCPDPDCEKQGVMQMAEMETLAGKDIMDKHRAFRLNTEVALDANRAWCPGKDCGAICHVCTDGDGGNGQNDGSAVKCESCEKEFCSVCRATWHPGMTCVEYGQSLVKSSRRKGSKNKNIETGSEILFALAGGGDGSLHLDGGVEIKPCPMCRVPIEREAGCAQMMCKRCKHVFCWFCRESLNDDFLLRHYDSGKCKGKLGHSRASVLWHRAQVIGIFAGFGLLLTLASPFLLVAVPCIICCRCKIIERLEAEVGLRDEGAAGGAATAEDNSSDAENAAVDGIVA